MSQRRIILNNDFYNIFQIDPPVDDQDIYDAVDKIAGTQVDTLTLDIPGVAENSALDPDLQQLYEHPEGDTCIANLRALAESGKDPFGMVLDRAHEKGLAFFGSIRLNDTHYKDQPFNPFVSQFYYDNLENRLDPQAVGTRLDTEYDYRKTVVREHYAGLIRSVVEKYDVDGFELNFTRNCKFFPGPHAEECAPLLTQFVRDVRAILDAAGEKRGKRLELCALVPYSLYRCRREGLDVPAWARLGLIDILGVLTPFLANFDHDIRDVAQKVGDIPVYAGCDRNMAYGCDGTGRVVPMQTYRAMAMNYMRQGAVGSYLFNVMSWTQNFAKANAAVKRHGGQGNTKDAPIDYDRELMQQVGSLESLRYLDKLYVVSHGEAAEEAPPRLPVTVPAGGEVTLRLDVGDDIAAVQERVRRIALQTVSSNCDELNNYTVYLNGVDLSRQYAYAAFAENPDDVLLYPEPGRLGALPEPAYVRRHQVRPIDVPLGANYITLKSYAEAFTITHVELAIYFDQPAAGRDA